MTKRGEVLVAIMNETRDLQIAREHHWYRIPVASVERFLKDRWAPELLAFYQTKEFGDEGCAVNYFARVLDIREVTRRELFPEESNPKAEHKYFQLVLSPLERLAQPIPSRRWRRIVFIPTTLDKFANAVEINDLFDESPLEDRLWAVLKLNGIRAERQEFVNIEGELYAPDFTVHCAGGKLAIETEGDTWHTDREHVSYDNRRFNDLQTAGWKILRFGTRQINEEMAEYCVPKIQENIQELGGIAVEAPLPTSEHLDVPQDWQQLLLFDSTQAVVQPRSKRRSKKAHRKGLV